MLRLKNNLLILITGMFILGGSVACTSDDKRSAYRKVYMIEADEDLEKVQRKNSSEVQEYKRFLSINIEENNLKMANLKREIALKEESTQSVFRRKLQDLEKKNDQLNIKLKNHKYNNDQSSWEEFKSELDRDLKSIQQSLNDIFI